MKSFFLFFLVLALPYDCRGRPAETDKKQRSGDKGVMDSESILDRIFDYTGPNNALLGATSSNIRAAHANKFRDKQSVTVLGHSRLTPEVVNDALKQGIERRTLLLQAITTDNLEIVDLLMRAPPKSNIYGFASSEIRFLPQQDIFCSTATTFEMLRLLNSHHFVCYQKAADNAIERGDMESVQWFAIEKGLISDEYLRQTVAKNDLQFIHYLVSRYSHLRNEICDEAARTGQIAVLDLVNSMTSGNCSENVFYEASKMNQIEVLKWAQENLLPPRFYNGGYYAALHGDLPHLKWLKSHGVFLQSEICEGAAAGGNLDVLAWANEVNVGCDERVYFEAKMNGKDYIIEQAKLYKIPFGLSGADCDTAAAQGKLDVIQWFKKQNAECGPATWRLAVRKGQHNVAEWALREGQHIELLDLMDAAIAGHYDMLELADRYGSSLLPVHFEHLARSGNITTIEWAFARIEDPEEKLKAAQSLFDQAADGIQATVPVSEKEVKQIMDWALANGAIVSAAAIEEAARVGCSKTFITRLVETRMQDISSNTAYYLARSGRVELLQLAVENGVHPNINTCKAAIQSRRLRVLHFLLLMKNDMSLECRRLASGESGVVKAWIREN